MEMAMTKAESSIGIVFEEIRPCGQSGGGGEQTVFDNFRSAQEYAKNNPGMSLKRNPNGNGFVVK